mgnify:CR=1 FL=1
MSTDHPGRPFRYGIRFKIAVSIGVIMVALMAVDILWNLSLQNAQAENEAREKAEVLAAEMRAAWDFVDMNQEVINRAEDGTFRTKHLVCVVAAKSISMLFTTETDYSIRFTNLNPRNIYNTPDAYEAAAIDGVNAWQKFWKITFPLIGPFFTINLVLSMKNALGTFDQVVALTEGGPNSSTETVTYLIWKGGLTGGEYAYQTANAVLFFIVLAIIAFVQLRISRSQEQI